MTPLSEHVHIDAPCSVQDPMVGRCIHSRYIQGYVSARTSFDGPGGRDTPLSRAEARMDLPQKLQSQNHLKPIVCCPTALHPSQFAVLCIQFSMATSFR